MLFFLHSIWYWFDTESKLKKSLNISVPLEHFMVSFELTKAAARIFLINWISHTPWGAVPYIHLTFNRTSRDRIATDKTRTEILKTNVYYVISQNLYVQPPPSPILTPLSWIQPEPPTVAVHPRRRKLQICIYTKLQKQGSHSKPKHSSNVVQNVHFTHCEMLIRQILCIL